MPSQFADDEIINSFVEYIKIKLVFGQNEGVNYFNILLIWSTNNAVQKSRTCNIFISLVHAL